MKLFKGKFNHQGQIFELYTKALDEEKALINFTRQLGRSLGINPGKIYAYFKMDKRKKYEMEEVKQ